MQKLSLESCRRYLIEIQSYPNSIMTKRQLIFKGKVISLQKWTHKDILQTNDRGRMVVLPWKGQQQMSLGVATLFIDTQPHTYFILVLSDIQCT